MCLIQLAESKREIRLRFPRKVPIYASAGCALKPSASGGGEFTCVHSRSVPHPCEHSGSIPQLCVHWSSVPQPCVHSRSVPQPCVHSRSVPSLLCTPSLSANFGRASLRSHMRKFLKSASFLSPLSKTVIHFIIIIIKGPVFTWLSSSIHTHQNQQY